jgi:hypothetical protein
MYVQYRILRNKPFKLQFVLQYYLTKIKRKIYLKISFWNFNFIAEHKVKGAPT